MAEELRALHDRMGATTVYVTHDQLEAMQMGDKIVVMNHGVVEQWGTPQEIYDRPASMFVADFIGSPPMNFLRFEGTFPPGAERGAAVGGVEVPIPPAGEGVAGRAAGARGAARARAPRRRRRPPRRGVGRRIPRHHPDRHAPHRQRRGEGAHPGERRGCGSASRSGSASTPRRCRSSTPAAAGRCRSTARRRGRRQGGRPMAEVRLSGVSKRFGDVAAVHGPDA